MEKDTGCVSRRELEILLIMARRGVMMFYKDFKNSGYDLSYDSFEWFMKRLQEKGLVRRVGKAYVLSEELKQKIGISNSLF